jgi:multidrug efflux pump subunit AcrA (membrane-fusion protein)
MSPVVQGPIFDLHRGRSADPGVPALRLVSAPRSVRVLASVLVGLLVLLVVGLIVTPWQQSVVGHGRVVAFAPVERHQKLEAPVDGRVARVLVLEGQKVLEDEVVVEITDVDPRFLERLESERQLVRLRKDAADARLQSVSDRVSALQQGREMALAAADARVDMAKDRVRQAEQALVAAEAARDAAELNLPRVQELAQKGIRSTRDAELATLEATRAKAEVERLKASLTASRTEVDSLVAERNRVEKDTAAAVNDARASEQVARAEIAAASSISTGSRRSTKIVSPTRSAAPSSSAHVVTRAPSTKVPCLLSSASETALRCTRMVQWRREARPSSTQMTPGPSDERPRSVVPSSSTCRTRTTRRSPPSKTRWSTKWPRVSARPPDGSIVGASSLAMRIVLAGVATPASGRAAAAGTRLGFLRTTTEEPDAPARRHRPAPRPDAPGLRRPAGRRSPEAEPRRARRAPVVRGAPGDARRLRPVPQRARPGALRRRAHPQQRPRPGLRRRPRRHHVPLRHLLLRGRRVRGRRRHALVLVERPERAR